MKKKPILASLLALLFLSLFFTAYLLFLYPQPSKKLTTIALETLTSIPVKRSSEHNFIYPQLTATAAYAIDLESMTILYQKNEIQQLPPASTSKMLTALVALENFDLNQELSISTQAAELARSLPFKTGDKITLNNLLTILLVNSDNAAAYALAGNDPSGDQAFIEKMNLKAKELHLSNSHFVNPAGFDENENFSSAHDLAVLAKALLANSQLRQLVASPSQEIILANGQNYMVYNTNQLFEQIGGVEGVKTGTTDLAGEVLVSLIKRNGHSLLLVVMQSEDRYQDTQQLLAWILNNYQWQKISSSSSVADFTNYAKF